MNQFNPARLVGAASRSLSSAPLGSRDLQARGTYLALFGFFAAGGRNSLAVTPMDT